MSQWTSFPAALAVLSYIRPAIIGASAQEVQADVDVAWYAPSRQNVNNLTHVLETNGVWGFIYNSSHTPDSDYGTYNWCNMPHVRSKEYVKAAEGFELQYVEVVRSKSPSCFSFAFS
jgi:hypothetical protein